MNPKQPFYVDVGTSIVAIRCASNHDVIERYDYVSHPHTLKLAEDICDRMNREVEIHNSGDCAKLREALKLCMDEMCNRCRDLASARGNPLPCLQGCEPVRKAKAALAAPGKEGGCEVSEEVIVTSEFVKNAKHLYRAALNNFKARCDYTNCPIKKNLDKVMKSAVGLRKALTRFNYGVDPLAEGGAK